MRDDGEFQAAFAPHEEFGRCADVDRIDEALAAATASASTKGFMWGLWRIKPLADNVCRVMQAGRAELGGRIPMVATTFGVKNTINLSEDLHDKYERGYMAVDAELREVFLPPPLEIDLNDDQKAVADRCKEMEVDGNGSAWEKLKSPSPFVGMWMKDVGDDEAVRK
jgi:hypothetical protein